MMRTSSARYAGDQHCHLAQALLLPDPAGSGSVACTAWAESVLSIAIAASQRYSQPAVQLFEK